jgi:hypothetical protein
LCRQQLYDPEDMFPQAEYEHLRAAYGFVHWNDELINRYLVAGPQEFYDEGILPGPE